VALGLILLFVVFVRVRLLPVPLERDEGEFAYAGQLILQGIPPYQLVYNVKLPGIYAAYALLMAVFGQTPSGIHLGLLFVKSGRDRSDEAYAIVNLLHRISPSTSTNIPHDRAVLPSSAPNRKSIFMPSPRRFRLHLHV
jgi:hypothetical protein